MLKLTSESGLRPLGLDCMGSWRQLKIVYCEAALVCGLCLTSLPKVCLKKWDRKVVCVFLATMEQAIYIYAPADISLPFLIFYSGPAAVNNSPL